MLKSGERIDDLQRNGLKIIQDPGRFCFGMDAVLLSGFASAGIRQGMRVLDLGTGTGIIPLLLSAKTQAESLCGLEIQADSADMARRSIAMNHLEDRISVIQGDIKEADKLFAAASFDVVTSNPPYMIGQHGLTNPEAPKAIARHEVLCTFEDIAAQTARLLDTLSKQKLEPKRMQLVYPYADREPNMVLLQAVRGGKPRMTVEKPLVIYKEPGVYTEEIYGIYGY